LGRKEVKMMQGFLFLWKCRASSEALSLRNRGEALEFPSGYILIDKKNKGFFIIEKTLLHALIPFWRRYFCL
jgi:hypothetical protein